MSDPPTSPADPFDQVDQIRRHLRTSRECAQTADAAAAAARLLGDRGLAVPAEASWTKSAETTKAAIAAADAAQDAARALGEFAASRRRQALAGRPPPACMHPAPRKLWVAPYGAAHCAPLERQKYCPDCGAWARHNGQTWTPPTGQSETP